MTHLGAHVYRWSTPDQHRLLREGLGPIAGEARSLDLCQRFWYTVFDARGPHVLAIFTLARNSGAEDLEHRRHGLETFLRTRIEEWLAANPSKAPLARAEVERRHEACRGKELSPVDEEPGLAANDSLLLYDHPADGYPFRQAGGMTRAGELWEELEAQGFWALDHLGDAAAAIRLAATVDRTLRAMEAPAGSFWRFVAQTLIVPLRDRLRREEESIVASLPEMIGTRNLQTFSRFWDTPPSEDDPPVEHAVRLAFEDDGRPLKHRIVLLREVLHSSLAQLLQGVQFRIPLVLYAWHRNQSTVSTP